MNYNSGNGTQRLNSQNNQPNKFIDIVNQNNQYNNQYNNNNGNNSCYSQQQPAYIPYQSSNTQPLQYQPPPTQPLQPGQVFQQPAQPLQPQPQYQPLPQLYQPPPSQQLPQPTQPLPQPQYQLQPGQVFQQSTTQPIQQPIQPPPQLYQPQTTTPLPRPIQQPLTQPQPQQYQYQQPPTQPQPQQYQYQQPQPTTPLQPVAYQQPQFQTTTVPIFYNSPPPPQPQVYQPQYQQNHTVMIQQPVPTSPIQPFPYQTAPITYERPVVSQFERPSISEAKNVINILNQFTDYIEDISKESLISLLQKKKIKKKMSYVIKAIQGVCPNIRSQKFYKILKKFTKYYQDNKRQIKKRIKENKDVFNDFDELCDCIEELKPEIKYDKSDSSSSSSNSSESDSDKHKTKHYSNPSSPINSSYKAYNNYSPRDTFNSSMKRSISPPPSLKRSITPPPSFNRSITPPKTKTKVESKPIKKEEPKESCTVCMDDVCISEIFISPCKEHHRFCKECGRRSFNNDMKNKQIPTCAMQCGYEYTVGDVEKLFEGKEGLPFVLQSFTGLHDEVFLRSKMVECPRRGCGGKGYLDNGDTTEEVQCPKCNEMFCPRCQLISHPGFECDSIRRFEQQWYEWNINGRDERRRQKGDVERLTNEARAKDTQRKEEIRKRLRELQQDEEYKKKHCKLCPNCKVPIEKTEGCRDMICGQNYHGGNNQPGCGHHFDYYDEGLDYVPTIENHMENEDFFKNIPKINNEEHEYACSNCHKQIRGIRFGCLHSIGFYLCENCEADENIRRNHHPHGDEHIFRVITSPADF